MKGSSFDFGQVFSVEDDLTPEKFLEGDEPESAQAMLAKALYRHCVGKQRHFLYVQAVALLKKAGVNIPVQAELCHGQYTWQQLEDWGRALDEEISGTNAEASVILRALDDVVLLLSQEEHVRQPKLRLQRCPLCWRIIPSHVNGKKRRFCSWHIPGSNGYKQAVRVLNTKGRTGCGLSAVQEIYITYKSALHETPFESLVTAHRFPLNRAYRGKGSYSFVSHLYGQTSLLTLFAQRKFANIFPETFKFAAEHGFDGENFQILVQILNDDKSICVSNFERNCLDNSNSRAQLQHELSMIKELYAVYESNLLLFWPEISFAEAFLTVQNMRKPGRPGLVN